jgi:hypothetical protein
VADLFEDNQDEVVEETTEEKVEEEKIKLGEDEFSKDELSELVKLGKIGREAEEKYKTKIDRVWPEYTKAQQKLKEFEESQSSKEKEDIEKKAQSGEELTEDEMRKRAREEAKKLGLMTEEDFELKYTQRREVEKLLDTCKGLEDDINGEDGRPVFKTQDVLEYMQENGIRDPEKAYKVKYEEELDKWKEGVLKKAKPKGLVTEESSPAGSKQPQEVKATKDNLSELINESLYGKGE